MRIWIDLSAPAHPVVFRPLVRRLREAGHEVEVTARDFAQTLELAEIAGLDALAVGAHGGRSAGGKLRSLAGRSTALWRWARTRPALRPRRGARLERPADRRARAARARGRPLRLRVGDVPAHDRLPARAPRDRARRDPSRAPQALRRRAAQAAPYPGLKEEYFLHDFEPDPRHPREGRRRPGAHRRGAAHAARRRALPPRPQPRLRRAARPPRDTTRASTPWCSRACASRPRSCAAWPCPR